MEHPLRAPCEQCGGTAGHITEKGGQDVVYCVCGRYQYCAPRHETGRDVRPVNERPEIKPSRRARILDRDNGLCIVCGAQASVIGHLISVADGRRHEIPDDIVWSDDNLAAMCAECNAGWGKRSLNPRLIARVIHLHQLQEERTGRR